MMFVAGRIWQGSPDLENLDEVASGVTGTDVAIGVAILAGTWPVAWLIGWIVGRAVRRFPVPEYLNGLLVRLARTMVSLIGLAVAMSWFGVDVAWFTVVLAFSALVAFLMLKPLVENFSAGLVLETRGAFGIGDEIETKGHKGKVVEVNGRTTVIRTRDGRRIHIPSTDVLASPFTVYTAFDSRRSSIVLGIDDTADLEPVIDVLVDAVAGVEGVLKDPKASIRARGFANGTVLLELRWWHAPTIDEELQVYDKVVRKLAETFSAEGIVVGRVDLDIRDRCVVAETSCCGRVGSVGEPEVRPGAADEWAPVEYGRPGRAVFAPESCHLRNRARLPFGLDLLIGAGRAQGPESARQGAVG